MKTRYKASLISDLVVIVGIVSARLSPDNRYPERSIEIDVKKKHPVKDNEYSKVTGSVFSVRFGIKGTVTVDGRIQSAPRYFFDDFNQDLSVPHFIFTFDLKNNKGVIEFRSKKDFGNRSENLLK